MVTEADDVKDFDGPHFTPTAVRPCLEVYLANGTPVQGRKHAILVNYWLGMCQIIPGCGMESKNCMPRNTHGYTRPLNARLTLTACKEQGRGSILCGAFSGTLCQNSWLAELGMGHTDDRLAFQLVLVKDVQRVELIKRVTRRAGKKMQRIKTFQPGR